MVMTRGQGRRIWDADGREYLDFSGGIAVLSVGHCHPVLAKAIADQAATLMHTSNLFYTEKELLFAAELVKRTGFSRVYFGNSGTEANEALIKLGRRWHYEQGDKERTELVSTIHSFHGRTMGAVTLTGQPKYHAGMGPMLPGVHHIAYGDLSAMEAIVTDKTAAVFLEPIQAEGGIIVGSDAYLRGVREICDRKGALLFFDEVQTGFGRTGKFLGREWSGVMPDACSLAKGIGGGFPLSAMVCTEKLAHGLPVGSHGTTFGGNPLACAAASRCSRSSTTRSSSRMRRRWGSTSASASRRWHTRARCPQRTKRGAEVCCAASRSRAASTRWASCPRCATLGSWPRPRAAT
jgi:acetylornithine/succinyldiaminopimelate/putrescine aminotransferase